MLNRRNLLAAAALLAFAPLQAARAAESDFTMEAFKAAQKDGKSVLVDVWASWCPTCKAQGPILKSELAKPENKNVVMLRVNFDTQIDVLKAFKVQSQSTLIMFKGDKETARSVGDTSPASIGKLIGSGV
jgi:thioredoxin 1